MAEGAGTLPFRTSTGPSNAAEAPWSRLTENRSEARIAAYFDPEKTNEEIKAIYPSLMMTGNRIVGPEAPEENTQ